MSCACPACLPTRLAAHGRLTDVHCLPLCKHRFCDDSAMDSVAKRNEIAEEDYKLEVLMRGFFHRDDGDLSGGHNTCWVPLQMLQEVDRELAQRLVQRFLNLSFSEASAELDCCTPSTVQLAW